jgi:hypothetical protein
LKNLDYNEYIIDDDDDVNNNNYEEYEIDAAHELKMQAQIRKLKLETVYYFKIQERNSREYLTQSKIIIFKTPNINGKGAKIVNYKKTSQNKDLLIKESILVNNNSISKYHLDINFVWITVSSIIGILILILLLVTILLCKRSINVNNSLSNKKIYEEQQLHQQHQQQQQHLINKHHNYETTTNSTSVSPSNINIDLNSTTNPSQKLLINTTATWLGGLNNSTSNGVITSISGDSAGGCIGNCASSFISNHSAYGQNNNSVIMSALNEQHQNTYSLSSTGSSKKICFF